MTYRDDLDAAHARADAAEREADELRDKLARIDEERRPVVRQPPDYRVVVDQGGRLTVSWKAHGAETALALLGLVIAPLALLIFELDRAFWLVFGIAVTLVYLCIAALANRTVLTLDDDRIEVASRPWPVLRVLRIRRADIAQLFVEAVPRGSGVGYALCALRRDGLRATVVDPQADADAMRWLEHELERRLGLPPRPVAGELDVQ
jgi:hypothetical protein